MLERPSYILTNFRLFNDTEAFSSLYSESLYSESLYSTAHSGLTPALHIDGPRIQAAGLLSDMPDQVDVIDAQGHYLSPGFMDLQLNGCGGVLFNADISARTLDIMHATNLLSGCTAFLPTLITSSDEDMIAAINVVRAYRHQHPERVPGLHLEGPYLNTRKKGIHEEHLIRRPSASMIDQLCANADVITKVTLAPEVLPAGMIEKLVSAGIIVALGHTQATCEEAKMAERAGAHFVTHLHNAMTPLTSREPGVVGATLDSDTLYAGIIADGYHLSWENLRIAHKMMQGRLVLVTDAVTPAGTHMTEFDFAGQTIFHKQGKCTSAEGTLAGSALTMIKAIKNSITQGIDQISAIKMATINAANAIGMEDRMGSVLAGQYANLTLLDDHWVVKGTVSGGRIDWH